MAHLAPTFIALPSAVVASLPTQAWNKTARGPSQIVAMSPRCFVASDSADGRGQFAHLNPRCAFGEIWLLTDRISRVEAAACPPPAELRAAPRGDKRRCPGLCGGLRRAKPLTDHADGRRRRLRVPWTTGGGRYGRLRLGYQGAVDPEGFA